MPAKPSLREITLPAIFLGILLSVVMGAANVYLGLKAGMTVSASIPASVIAMGILRGIFRRHSILESNLVQTAASAGESLAAGIIFTMPALVLVGIWQEFDFWTTSLIALAGGLLGVLLMIPMRRVFVVSNEELKFPEGVACAEVLRAGSDELNDAHGGTGLRLVVLGIAVGAVFKFLSSFVGLIRGAVEGALQLGGRVFYVGADISPALLAVGFIVGLPIAVQIFVGGAIGWLVAIPLLGSAGMEADSSVELAGQLWDAKIRYLGVGAMVVGGVASIWHVRHGLLAAAREILSVLRGTEQPEEDHEKNISGGLIISLTLLCALLIGSIYFVLLDYSVGITALTTVVMLVMSFFFAAVASYIVGLVGSSNSPVSGMTITAVLGTGALILMFGFTGEAGMIATLGVAGVVCCVACTSGDVCNDLKTGQLVGASPRSQQRMQLVGVFVAAFVMAPVMNILHRGSLNDGTGGIGGRDLSAPQAGLFASLAKGFFGNESLAYDMVAWGAGIGVVILVIDAFLAKSKSTFRLHVMPVAVGMYLPFGLSVPILIGGLIHHFASRRNGTPADSVNGPGILITSGIIAGESLIGVLLGVLSYCGIASVRLSEFGSGTPAIRLGWDLLALAALLSVVVVIYVVARNHRVSDSPSDPT